MGKYEIDVYFENDDMRNDKGHFRVNPNKAINPYDRDIYPIIFEGSLSKSKIKILLKNSNSDFIENYDFIEYSPNEFFTKDEIIDEIHRYIHKKTD